MTSHMGFKRVGDGWALGRWGQECKLTPDSLDWLPRPLLTWPVPPFVSRLYRTPPPEYQPCCLVSSARQCLLPLFPGVFPTLYPLAAQLLQLLQNTIQRSPLLGSCPGCQVNIGASCLRFPGPGNVITVVLALPCGHC